MSGYYIKFRTAGKGAWFFATPRGEATRLRIHAARFDSKEAAEAVAANDQKINPELDFKVVPAATRRGA